MLASDFDFDLPPELIAQFPAPERAASRMLHLDGASGSMADDSFRNLPEHLRAGDVLVMNDTRVIRARLSGFKDGSGGRIEALIERVLDEHHALAQIRASHAPRPGALLHLGEGVEATVVAADGGFYLLEFEGGGTVLEALERCGAPPLPPYITRAADAADEARYQTVYARHPGAVAAPTAGLHFDEEMLARIGEAGARIAYVTLHVGAGTFQPVRVENIAEHRMHAERYFIPEETVQAIAEAGQRGGRVLAVGSTSLRALEAAAADGELRAGAGETAIFITPGYRFRIVERLLTNFHLPRSTLLMLVSAFAGVENVRRAYAHAVRERYRFFSYGDAMLIERR